MASNAPKLTGSATSVRMEKKKNLKPESAKVAEEKEDDYDSDNDSDYDSDF